MHLEDVLRDVAQRHAALGKWTRADLSAISGLPTRTVSVSLRPLAQGRGVGHTQITTWAKLISALEVHPAIDQVFADIIEKGRESSGLDWSGLALKAGIREETMRKCLRIRNGRVETWHRMLSAVGCNPEKIDDFRTEG